MKINKKIFFIFIIFICLTTIFIINSYGLTYLKVIFERIINILM